MERITKRIDETHACYAICEKECPDGIYEDNPACKCTASHMALKRLLEYEDTGLTPEQIRSIATELKEYKQLGLSPKRLSEHVAFCHRYHELFGAIDFSRLLELKERDTAKEPQLEGDGYADGEMVYDEWICPNCGEHYEVDYDDHDFCPNCGQMILR